MLVGVMCYVIFGENIKIQVIFNFFQDLVLVNVVQFLYLLVVLVGEFVQLFFVVWIIEMILFGEWVLGRKSVVIKWKKNGLCMVVMVLCIGISIVGVSDLDKFVVLIGSFVCVLLVYIYLVYLYYCGVVEIR